MLMDYATEDPASVSDLNRLLAMESMIPGGAGVLEIFSRLLPKSTDVLASFTKPIQGFLDNTDSKPVLKKSEFKEIVRAVSSLPFVTYSDTLIMVPQGFHGNLDKYLDSLLTLNNDLIAKANEVVKDYITEISIFLNNVEARKSIRSYETFYMKMNSERAKYEKILQGYFKEKDTRTRAKLGDVVSRFGEFESIFIKTEKLEAVHSKKELKELLSNVNHAVELLGLIRDKLQEENDIVISAAMAKHIAEGAQAAGRYVELVSIACFNIEIALSVVNSLVEQFASITGKK